jgi:hypothetical protein
MKEKNVTLLHSKITERGKLDTPNRYIHDYALSWLDTGTSINSGRDQLVLLAQTDKYTK